MVAPDGTLTAAEGSDADGQMDLLTVLLHEIGHLLDVSHHEHGLMAETLDAGTRYLPDEETTLAALTSDHHDDDNASTVETELMHNTQKPLLTTNKPQPRRRGAWLIDPLLNLLRRS